LVFQDAQWLVSFRAFRVVRGQPVRFSGETSPSSIAPQNGAGHLNRFRAEIGL
jgi:hypothetical protein